MVLIYRCRIVHAILDLLMLCLLFWRQDLARIQAPIKVQKLLLVRCFQLIEVRVEFIIRNRWSHCIFQKFESVLVVLSQRFTISLLVEYIFENSLFLRHQVVHSFMI